MRLADPGDREMNSPFSSFRNSGPPCGKALGVCNALLQSFSTGPEHPFKLNTPRLSLAEPELFILKDAGAPQRLYATLAWETGSKGHCPLLEGSPANRRPPDGV